MEQRLGPVYNWDQVAQGLDLPASEAKSSGQVVSGVRELDRGIGPFLGDRLDQHLVCFADEPGRAPESAGCNVFTHYSILSSPMVLPWANRRRR